MTRIEQESWIRNALDIFHIEDAYSYSDYRAEFQRLIEQAGSQFFFTQVKEAFTIAKNTSDWNWKETAFNSSFYFQSHQANSACHLLEIKLMLWDFLFPEEVIPLQKLNRLFSEYLKELWRLSEGGNTWTSYSRLLDQLAKVSPQFQNFELYDLMRMNYELDKYELIVDIKFDNPNEWFFRYKNVDCEGINANKK